MDPDRVKHLEMIQAVVARLNGNSFTIKAWTVGLISALFALGAEKHPAPPLFLVALVPTATFGLLDAYYLRQERLFRRLYDEVRSGTERAAGPFAMSVQDYVDDPTVGFLTVAASSTIAGLYLPLAVLVLTVAWLAGR